MMDDERQGELLNNVQNSNDVEIDKSVSRNAPNSESDRRYDVGGYLQHAIASAGVIGTAVCAGPYFMALTGGFAVMLAVHTTYGQSQKIKRIENLINKINEIIRNLGEDKIDKEWLGTEEHQDFIREGFAAAAKARTDVQVELYAKILVGAAVPKFRAKHDIEAYLDLLASLSPHQVSIASIIWEHQCDKTDDELWAPSPNVEQPWQQQVLKSTVPVELLGSLDLGLLQLENAGLVRRIYIEPGDKYLYPVGVPIVSERFQRLMQLVEHDFENVDSHDFNENNEPHKIEDRILIELVNNASGSTPAIVLLKTLKSICDNFNDLDENKFLKVLTQLVRDGFIVFDSNADAARFELSHIRRITICASGLDMYLRMLENGWKPIAKNIADAVYSKRNFDDVCNELKLSKSVIYHLAEKLKGVGIIRMPERQGRVSWLPARESFDVGEIWRMRL